MGRMTGRSEERGEGVMGVARVFGLEEKEIQQDKDRRGKDGNM